MTLSGKTVSVRYKFQYPVLTGKAEVTISISEDSIMLETFRTKDSNRKPLTYIRSTLFNYHIEYMELTNIVTMSSKCI